MILFKMGLTLGIFIFQIHCPATNKRHRGETALQYNETNACRLNAIHTVKDENQFSGLVNASDEIRTWGV